MPDDKQKGLYNKYTVERTDGQPLKGGACIVLEFGDPIARKAIMAWAKEMRRNGYYHVYEDTITALAKSYPHTVGVGDFVLLDDGQHWEVLAIYDIGADRFESKVRLKKLTNDGPPTRKTTYKEVRMLEILRFFAAHPQP